MFKKLGKLLKKGAMSVEYIVIGVCVIGMAALATAFVSNKMDIAMGQENNAGDTNAGNGGSSNNEGNNDTVLSAECNKNKEFFEKWGLYPGNYSFLSLRGGNYEYKTDITLDGKITFTLLKDDSLYSVTNIDLNSNTYNSKSSTKEQTGTFLGMTINYSDENLNKELLYSCRLSPSNTKYDRIPWFLPKEAYKLGGHEDCSSFRTEKQDFMALNGIEYGEYNFTENKNQNITVNISENKIRYIDETMGYNFTLDLVSETIYNSTSTWLLEKVTKSSTTSDGITIYTFTRNDGAGININIKNGKCYYAYVTNMN